MPKSDIAFGSEFSPEQINLAEVLGVLFDCDGSRDRLNKVIAARWYKDPEVGKNLPLALRAYGIIEWGDGPGDTRPESQKRKEFYVTEAGKKLVNTKPRDLHGEFAKHIMLTVPGGMDVVTAIEDITRSGKAATMDVVRQELERRGLHVPKNGMHATRIRQWLEKGGVITPAPHRVNDERRKQLLGYASEELEALTGLNAEQKAFARALARMGLEEVRSNEVANYASQVFGVRFPDTGLPGAVLEALKARGLITYEKTTTGRGAKPSIVRPTERLLAGVFEPLVDALEKIPGINYRALLRLKWDDIISDLKSTDKHKKGIALEALAAKLAFLLELDFVEWRLRGAATGGAEVDLVVEDCRLVYRRWNIQCKNTASVRLDDVAKEVGVAVSIGSNVVMVVSTGKFSQDAYEHARHVMLKTNLSVILIDGRDLDQIVESPAAIATILARTSKDAKALKKLEIEK